MTTQETLPFGYPDNELADFKKNIDAKLDKALRELDYLKDLEDDPTENKEQLQQMIVRQETFINNLNLALIRIENKTYGICRITGKLIDKPRLMAVPHATLSLEAKLAVNKNGPDVPVIEVPKKEKKKRVVKPAAVEPGELVREDLSEQYANAKQYSTDDLRNFKTLISNKIEEANSELKYLKVVLADREKGIKVENHEDMSPAEVRALIDRKNSYIRELEDALDRIKKKTFGICEETGELIPKDVLLRHPIIKRLCPTPERPSSTIENKTEDDPVRKCRICGCTDDDCHLCIEKTGKRCHWIDVDLCSACEEEAMKESEDTITIETEPEPELITPSNNDNDMNFFQQLAQAAAQNVDLTIRIMQKDNKLTVNIMPGSKSVTIKPILVTGTAAELDDEFFKTIAPGINEISGIVHNLEDVKKDLVSKKAADIKKEIDTKKAQDKKEEKKPYGKKFSRKKAASKVEKEEIKPEVNDTPGAETPADELNDTE